MSKLQVCADWSRPSPSSPRLPVLGSVQSDLTVGPDRTEPYPRLGPSGLVESLDIELHPVGKEDPYSILSIGPGLNGVLHGWLDVN